MSSLSIFVFDNADNFVIRRDLTSSELAAKSATFSLPKSLASTPCSFYAIANYDASSAKTRTALTALVEKSAADYNGTFAEVSTAAKRSGGFVMSGMKSQTVGAVNSTTNVGITLKRTVAKVALQTTIAPSFADKYAGTLTINSVKLSKAASQSLVVAGTPTPGAMTFSTRRLPPRLRENAMRCSTVSRMELCPRAAAFCWKLTPHTIRTAAPRLRTTARR